MAPHLRVLAGTGTTLTPITHLVNTTHAFPLVSDRFKGEVIVCIKGLTHPAKDPYPYFESSERQSTTWSIQVRGRFLEPISADDVLFGNTFDRPLALPWGSGAALKFMSFIDPTLEHDLTSQTHPWALSPLIATMPHFAHTRLNNDSEADDTNHIFLAPPSTYQPIDATNQSSLPSFPPTVPLTDDTSQLHLASSDTFSGNSSGSSIHGSSSSASLSSTISLSLPASSSYLSTSPRSSGMMSAIKHKVRSRSKSRQEKTGLGLKDASQRRAYFASAAHRQEIIFGPEDILTTDFCYGFLEFSPTLMLRLPGGLSFDLMRYWDGQPVRFVCCKRASENGERDSSSGVPWGEVFWSVVIEMDATEEELAQEA
ncbi:hypothetical protein H0H93_014713 [Arthromyces matolae]|nr:hypothetical protein H0H93_014713 [Arthromyces matolae]